MRVERRGYIVNLSADPEKPIRMRDTEIRILTQDDLRSAGFVPSQASPATPEVVVQSSTMTSEPPVPGDDHPRGPHAPAQPEGPSRPLVPTPSAPLTPAEPTEFPPPAEQVEVSDEPAGGRTDEWAGVSDPDLGSGADVAVELGVTEIDQDPVVWRPRVQGSPHMFVLGIPGQGKSWTVTRILTELHRQGLRSLVFDFHGQFSDPDGNFARAASPAILDASVGLPFSPFEANADQAKGARYWKTNAFAMAEIFQYVCGLGVIQQDLVYQAIRECYESVGFEEGRPTRLPTASELAERIAELETASGTKNVLPRCRPLLEFDLFPMESSPETSFSEVVGAGAILDVSRVGLEAVQLGASAFVLRKVYKDMFTWGESERLRLVLVLDEAHRLSRDITLPKIMKEGRKFGVAVVVASQSMADFHQDVLGNAGTKVVFRTNFPMSKKVAGFLRPERGSDLADAIEQLDVGEAYVQTPDMSRCARTRMTPLDER
jgi:hypothetical protein